MWIIIVLALLAVFSLAMLVPALILSGRCVSSEKDGRCARKNCSKDPKPQ